MIQQGGKKDRQIFTSWEKQLTHGTAEKRKNRRKVTPER
jgi:hypothetical protein